MKQFLNNLTGWGMFSLLLLCITTGSIASDHKFKIKEAKWEQEKSRLKVKGEGRKGKTVTLHNAKTLDMLGSTIVDDDNWGVKISNLSMIPCRVRAQQSDGRFVEKAVKKAPPNCDAGSPGGNTPPDAVDDGVSTSKNVAVTISVLSNDRDADGNTLSLSTVGQGENGSVTDNGNTVTYTPNTDFFGIDSFTYQASDGQAESNVARVSVTVRQQTGLLPSPVTIQDNTGLLGTDHPGHLVLAANDLGMHCADQDDSIFSVLPPFNVLHAQVIKRGTGNSDPRILTDTDVSVVYSAASNPNDPVGFDSINSTSANFPMSGTDAPVVYKGNFWELDSVSGNPIGFDAYSPLFFGLLTDPSVVPQDQGLPAPESSLLTDCLTSPASCNFAQQAMPGINNPYSANVPQATHFDVDFGFFLDLLGVVNGVDGKPLGSLVTNVNWFRADGIPILPVDDSGRGNAYPLVRVQALQGNTAVASTDVVLPVAAEADCQLCHADPIDCADPTLPPEIQTNECNGLAVSPTQVSNTDFQVATIEMAPGDTTEQKLLNAAKINILRLHDAKHETTLDETRKIVCASCHYSPALDLAQLGPNDTPDGTAGQGLPGTEQTQHISMSRAMHGHHGELELNGNKIFPDMPPPDQRSIGAAGPILEQTCYQCHPGKRTKCLRGAMGGSGIVCQDCHGNMTQVGNDFTGDFPDNHGQGDFAKRIPWASEPKCQSCHTGDAFSLNHPAGAIVASDGIRLLQAYTSSEHIISGGNATPIVSAQSRFAENQSLYRLSGNNDGSGKGHGGVMCEGCHGSTHAIWPNALPNANDNLAANQLQGHSGSIIECSSCHQPNVFEDSGLHELTMGGPHGMHAVGSRLWNKKHKEARADGGDNCRACHGQNGEGTVLSRMATERVLECKDRKGTFCTDEGPQPFPKGHKVGCADCHENEL